MELNSMPWLQALTQASLHLPAHEHAQQSQSSPYPRLRQDHSRSWGKGGGMAEV